MTVTDFMDLAFVIALQLTWLVIELKLGLELSKVDRSLAVFDKKNKAWSVSPLGRRPVERDQLRFLRTFTFP